MPSASLLAALLLGCTLVSVTACLLSVRAACALLFCTPAVLGTFLLLRFVLVLAQSATLLVSHMLPLTEGDQAARSPCA